MNGTVVVVSGTSGAGKTTTCRRLIERADETWFHFGFDLLVSSLIAPQYTAYGEKKEDYYYNIDDRPVEPGESRMGFGKDGWRSLGAFHDMIAAAAHAGQNMAVDHLLFLDPPILQDCIWRLQDVPVLFVLLKPRYDVLCDRLHKREFVLPPAIEQVLGDNAYQRIADGLEVMTPWLYAGAYKNEICDLLIDSDICTPDDVCRQIEARLAQGPGTAFEELRRKYPMLPNT